MNNVLWKTREVAFPSSKAIIFPKHGDLAPRALPSFIPACCERSKKNTR